MYQEHQVFETPTDKNAILWRYMDFTKFVSILANRTLYFTRADKYRDKFEGNFSSFNKTVYHEMYRDLNHEQRESLFRGTQRMNKALRERTVISCWHMNEYESAAMWDLYIKSNEGIAIQTTFNRLSESFNTTDKNIYIGKVKYIDFDKEWMPEGNAFYPFIHKRKSFEHEKEVRAMHSVFPEPNTPSPFDYGLNVEIDINVLIEKVYVSPDAPAWFSELVHQVLEKYDFNKPVIHSSLYQLPK